MLEWQEMAPSPRMTVRRLLLIAGTAAVALSLLLPAATAASAGAVARTVREKNNRPATRAAAQEPSHVVIPALAATGQDGFGHVYVSGG
jgi:predicted S18 family serine protease